jgi:poly-gamma-glutamate capsule biosynthesis protein CapA/YwtB (metallophosphatase superfamily)
MAKTPIAERVVAAAATVEDDVNTPTRKRSSSFTSVIADLAIGETAAKALRVDEDHSFANYVENGAEIRDQVRNNLAGPVREAKKQTGGDYTIEIIDSYTRSGALFVIALITRKS